MREAPGEAPGTALRPQPWHRTGSFLQPNLVRTAAHDLAVTRIFVKQDERKVPRSATDRIAHRRSKRGAPNDIPENNV
jgi:hypothetical protein